MKQAHKILHKKFQKFGANAKEWMRKCVLLLPEIEKYRIWEQKKFDSIYEYAAKLAGMGHDTVNDSLRILRKTENMPDLRKVIELKGIGIIKSIENLVTPENQSFWAEKALTMSKHTLEIYVQEFRKINEPETNDLNIGMFQRPGALESSGIQHQQALSTFDFDLAGQNVSQRNEVLEHSDDGIAPENVLTTAYVSMNINPNNYKKIVAMDLEPDVIEQLEKLKGQNGWNELMKQFLQMRAAELEQQKPAVVKTDSRYIPVKIQRFVFARTNGTCSFPGCTKPAKIRHHTQRLALEKIHDSDRLYGLCKEHERIAHLGLIENEQLSPQDWKLRLSPDKTLPTFQIDEMVNAYRKR